MVPRLGQWCAVHTTDAWGRLQLAAATHADEAMLPELHAHARGDRPGVGAGPAARRRPALGTQVPLGAPLEGFAVPLVARGQRLGTLAVGRHQRHRHDADEVAVLEDVARRAALAIDNARIHDERRRVARTLQRSLLPPVLPEVEGIGFAAEYVPTGDVARSAATSTTSSPLPDGRWLVVVGDVSGKGVQAATVTGLVRDVIRVLVGDGQPLPEIALPGSTRRWSSGAAGATARSPWPRSAAPPTAGSTSRCTWPGTTGRCCCAPTARPSFVGEGGTALGLLDTITSPADTRCRSTRATR